MSWGRNLRFGLLLHSFPLLFPSVSPTLMNVTVDDQGGDPITGLVPEYLPDGFWNVGSPTENCTGCHISPTTLDLNQIHDYTWHDSTPLSSTGPTSIIVRFTGSAVYVFNILPNTLPKTITFTNITFSIDGTNPHTFTHVPDPNSDSILYNQLVYQNTGLEDGTHTLTMAVAPDSLILFDYLVYTQSNTTTSATATSAPTTVTQSTAAARKSSSNTPVGAIAGGAVGGVVLLLGVAIGAFLLGQKRVHSKPAGSNTKSPPLPVAPDATLPSGHLEPVARWVDGAETESFPDATSDAVSGQVTLRQVNPVVALNSDSTSSAEWSSKRRTELTQRLETLQRTRSVLSSHSSSGRSQSEFNNESGTGPTNRELEAEIAQIRALLTNLNARLADGGHDEHLEPLPQYAE